MDNKKHSNRSYSVKNKNEVTRGMAYMFSKAWPPYFDILRINKEGVNFPK